jgi:hypothetical protein
LNFKELLPEFKTRIFKCCTSFLSERELWIYKGFLQRRETVRIKRTKVLERKKKKE